MDQFEAADGEFIETNIFVFFYTGDRGDMAYLRVLGLLEILQDGSSSDDATLQVVHPKALQVLDIEVPQ